MIQFRAARFTLGRFNNKSSVIEMLDQLQWETLEHCWKVACLVVFYKIQHSLVAVALPPIVIQPGRPRPGHPHHFQVPFCTTDAYMHNFFPSVIPYWNADFLPRWPVRAVFLFSELLYHLTLSNSSFAILY